MIWNQQHEPLAESTRKQWGTNKQDAIFDDSGKRLRSSTTDDPSAGAPMRDVWDISIIAPRARERVGYPTQKPLRLLDRIVRASTNPGDMVLDPFAGCATTCVSAENLGRDWIGIDLSDKAGELVMQRLAAGASAVRRTDITLRSDLPRRNDLGPLPRYNSPENRAALYGQQAGYCAGCGTHFELRNLETDHIISRARGGNRSHRQSAVALWELQSDQG